MRALVIAGVAVVTLWCAGTAPARARLSLSVNGDSIRIETDTIGAEPASMPERAHMMLSPDHPLAHIPPDAWAKMSPEQIRDLLETAIAEHRRESESGLPSFLERVALIVPIVTSATFFGALVLIVFFVARYKQRRSRELHEQHLAMIEKGIDPRQFQAPPKAPRTQRMMIWGYILSLGGLGWSIRNVAEDGFDDIGIGPILALIGVGLLLAARYVEKLRRERETELPAGNPPPDRA